METMTTNPRLLRPIGFAILAIVAAASTVHAQFEVINRGMRGYSVGKIAPAWRKALKENPNPDVVVLVIGTNDMINSEYLTPLDQFREQYDALVSQLALKSPHVVVGTLPPCIEEHLFRRHDRNLYKESPNERLKKANEIIKQIASERGLTLVDIDAIFSPGTWEEGNPEGLLITSAASGRADGVHPNEAGARKIGEAVAEKIKSLGITGGKIVCLGDSITYGGGIPGEGTTEGATYPAVVMQRLNSQ